MARFALALAAIVILILSAGLTHVQPQTPLRAGTTRAAAFRDNADTFRAELTLMKRAAPVHTPQRAPNEEPPAPALIVYLALILVGGAGSVVLARWRMRGTS